MDRPEYSARVRGGSRGRQRHGRRRRASSMPVILAAAAICVLAGGAYLGLHFATAGAGAPGVSPPPGRSHPPVTSSAATDTPTAAPSPAAGKAGDYHVAEARYTFTEHTLAAGTRILHVSVRYPVARGAGATTAGMFPLVVFAPGFIQCDDSYSALLRQWTSAGYVVAAVEFPLTNCHVPKPDEPDLSNQPADMAYVIHRLVSLSARRGDSLSGLISPSRVAVAGHSDGGDTVAAMAAMSCCRYPGLRAVMVLSGAEWPALRGRWFSAPTPPMLFVQGTADTVNPPSASIDLFKADTTGTRYYLELFGADHLSPYEGVGSPEPIVERVTIDFLDRYLAGQTSNVSAMRRAARVRGVSELVSGHGMP